MKQLHLASVLEVRFAATVLRCKDDLTKNSREKNKHGNRKISRKERKRDETKLVTGFKIARFIVFLVAHQWFKNSGEAQRSQVIGLNDQNEKLLNKPQKMSGT